MLPPRYRLRSSKRISDTIRHGQRARRGAVVVHVRTGMDVPVQGGLADSPGVARAAFAVSKAVGDSVTRHRVVRRLRAVLPELLDQLPAGTEVVVRAMPEAATTPSAQLREDLVRALGRVAVLDPDARPDAPDARPEARDRAVVSTEAPENPSTPAHSATPQAPRTGLGRVLHGIGWPVRSLLISLVWVYRHTISPILPPTCRYHPSCSAYGFHALQVHGAAKGSVLTAWRVLRCNPFTDGGLDPVPVRGAWRPGIHPDGTPRV